MSSSFSNKSRLVRTQRPAMLWLMALGIQVVAWVFAVLFSLVSTLLPFSFYWSLFTLSMAQGIIAACLSKYFHMPRWWFGIHLIFSPLVIGALILNLPAWVYFGFFILSCLFFWSTFRTRVPFFLTNKQTLEILATQIVKMKPKRFLDLGCASGGLLKQLAERFPEIQFIGYEYAPVPFLMAKWRLRNISNANVFYGDFWALDFSEYGMVYAFLSDEPMSQLWQKVSLEMREESTFISNTFGVPDIMPDQTIDIDDFRGSQLLVWCMSSRDDHHTRIQ